MSIPHPFPLAPSLCLALCLLLPAPSVAGEELVDGIAAQVGTDIVLISEVNHSAEPMLERLKGRKVSEEDVARLRAEILDRMIERALVRQVVRRSELTASDAEVEDAIARIAQENQLSVDELRKSVEAQGMSYDHYKDRIRDEIEHSKVVNGMVASKVHVEEKEIRALYEEQLGDQPSGGEEFLIRHILVTFPEKSSPEQRRAACDKVRGALERIRAGADFQTVAREVSETHPEDGGTVGWVHESALASWMKDTVEALQPGQVSDVIEMPFGCNLLQVAERRPFQHVSYEEARPLLRRRLWSQHMEKEYAKFIDQLREQTYIERKGIYADAARLDTHLPEERPRATGPDRF